jgi:hypothetical protein
VLVDTQAWGNKRKVTAFVGGLDLCDGRYGTPQHRIFKDLDNVFENEYQSPTFSESLFLPICPTPSVPKKASQLCLEPEVEKVRNFFLEQMEYIISLFHKIGVEIVRF